VNNPISPLQGLRMERALIRDTMELVTAMRVLMAAVVFSGVVLAAPSGARAAESSPVWKDGWTINVPGQSNWVSKGTPSPFNSQSAPSAPYAPGSTTDPYGFADYSIGRT